MVYLIPHEIISLSCFLQIFEQKMTQKSRKKTKNAKLVFYVKRLFVCELYYFQINIMRAQGLGMDIKLIQDGKPNALLYSHDKLINCKKLFEEYVNILFPLKNKNIYLAKDLLNIMWGILCERKLKTRKNGVKLRNIKIQCNEKIYQILPLDGIEKGELIRSYDPSRIFKYRFGRLLPFILSQGRRKISKFIEPFVDDIVHVHTDSSIVTKEIKSKDIINGVIGKMKYEGYSKHCAIKNCVHYIFE